MRASPRRSADLTYEQVFTDETGIFIFSVRAADADGKEEANIRQIVELAFEDGALVARPAEPRIVTATPIAEGKIEVEWLYDPRYEDPPLSGAAYEARIYWDAGTAMMEFDEPLATVAMGRPTATGRWSWQSNALEDGQTYLFVVRIATQAWPEGIETQNTDGHEATADSDQPAAPGLAAFLI